MKLLSIAVIVLSLCCIGCSNGMEAADGQHMPQDKMEKVLLDLHMAEVYSSMVKDSLHESRSKDMDTLAVFYKDIFAHHGITQQEFDESYDWYRSHPTVIDTIYKRMMVTFANMPGADTTGRK